MTRARFLLLAIGFGTTLAAQTVGLLRSGPLPSPLDMANLESHVLQNPEDINARLELLQVYLDSAPLTPDPGKRSVRLQHILYLVEHHPEAAASASKAAYVYSANGPYANAEDHDAVRDAWLAAVQAHPRSNAVTMNAVRFLEMEDKEDAERVLRRAVDAEPANREIAANLGFLYAMEILGKAPYLAGHASAELEQSSNAIVLAAAGTALPNLAVRVSGVRVVDQKIFDLARDLSARAGQLAPDDPDIQGPMPLIKYFAAAQETPEVKRIRVGENVQAANLIHKAEPQRPTDAQASGEVKFTAIIGRDGTIQKLELISGDPVLIDAAREAAETWVYKPTLLNGAPVEVVTTVTVSFPAN